MLSTKKHYLAVALGVAANLAPAAGQEIGGRQSIGVQASLSPDSSHILIGHAERRQIWTLGFDYSHRLFAFHGVRLDYEASVSPLFLERDPTISGEMATLSNGVVDIIPSGIVRVVDVRANLGTMADPGGGVVPVYPVTRGTQESYAAAIAPLGFRMTGFSSHRLRPTASIDSGIVLSKRDLIVDQTSRLNFLFSFGPGIEFFPKPDTSIRLEYLFRHVSDANLSYNNPGMDAGVFRITWSHHTKPSIATK
jgi:hypothetical protein